MPARRHRTNKDVVIGGVVLHTDPVAQYRSTSKWRARVDAEDCDLIKGLGVTHLAAGEGGRDEAIGEG
jgi:hypothetical protein